MAHEPDLQPCRWVYGDSRTAIKVLRECHRRPTAPDGRVLLEGAPAVKRTGKGGKGDPWMYSLS